MPFHPFTIDQSIVSTGGRSAYVRQGYYLLEIGAGVLCPETYEKELFVTWPLRIMDGPDGLGRHINRVTTWENSKQWALGQLAGAAGISLSNLVNIQIPSYASLQQLVDTVLIPALQGKQVCALVGDSDYSQSKMSEVKELFPSADWNELSRNNALLAQQAALTPPPPVVPLAPPPMVGQLFPGVGPLAAPAAAPVPAAPQLVPNGLPEAVPAVAPELASRVNDMFAGVQLGPVGA
jgi:hypothetical protein